MHAITGCDSLLGMKIASLLRERKEDVQCVSVTQDEESLASALTGCDTLYHCEEHIEFSNRSQEFFDFNVIGTENLLQAAVKAKVRRVLYVSSIGAAGPSQSFRAITEAHAPKPLPAPYQDTKFQAEEVVMRFAQESNIEVVIVRPSFLVGAGASYAATCFSLYANSFIRTVPGSRKHVYSLIGADDAAAGCLAAMEKGRSGEVYYLTGDDPLQMADILNLFSELSGLPRALGLSLPLPLLLIVSSLKNALPGLKEDLLSHEFIENYLTWNWIFSNDKAKHELGFSPRPIREDWLETILWAVEQGYVKKSKAEQVREHVMRKK
ncbi:MAG: NAD-dependent epimerase/dehydratase family protein [Clostridiales bacterium]|jgi:dihydroflavonol-4-reductase|nr:NAD-dependent epimerase/dehydratase family protein [Clostridiales bacterium]